MIEINEIVLARVSAIETYGAFLDYDKTKIFVKITDITWDDGVLDISDYVEVGSECKVKILKKVDDNSFGSEYLGSVKHTHSSDPWLSESYDIGKNFAGEVLSINDYGAIVRLATGVVGLIKGENIDCFKVGQSLNVKILSCDVAKRRIFLKTIAV